jgi:hypothetical protein
MRIKTIASGCAAFASKYCRIMGVSCDINAYLFVIFIFLPR